MLLELERRAAPDLTADGRRVRGYPVVFHQLSQDLGGFKEIILPEAVDRTLRENVDVRAIIDHTSDPTRVIGRRSAGTLRLTKDTTGLLAEIDLPKTTHGDDILQLVERRDVSGMSFTFQVMPKGDRFERRDGLPVRIISDMLIQDISIVTYPAYTATDVQVAQRSLQVFEAQRGQSIAWLRMRGEC